jgi:spore germination protein KC
VPSDSISFRLQQLFRQSLIAEQHIKITDVIERMEQSRTIVLPILSRTDGKPANDSGNIASQIDANEGNFIISGGAVIQNYRMTGKLNDDQLVLHHLLEGDRGRHVRRFELEGKPVSLEFNVDRIRREATWKSGQPAIMISMDLELSTAYASEYVPKSPDELKKLEQEVSQIIQKDCLALFQLSRQQGWDLLGIKHLLHKKTPNHPDLDAAEKNAKVSIHVNARLKRMGSLQKPYVGTG